MLNTEFALLKHKSADEIRTQIRLMYEPYTRDPKKPKLADNDFEALLTSVPSCMEATDRELSNFNQVLTELKLEVPIVKSSDVSLSGKAFLESVKRELKRCAEISEEKQVEICKVIKWENVLRECNLSEEWLEWVQYVAIKVLFQPIKFDLFCDLSKMVKCVFECFDNTEGLKLLRVATTFFMALYKQKCKKDTNDQAWEDYQWVESTGLLKTFDGEPIAAIVAFWEKNKFYLFSLLSINCKVFKECNDMFSDDQTFDQHLQTFAENDAVQSQRSSSFMQVRNTVVSILSQEYKNMTNMQERILHIAQDEMEAEKLKAFNVVCLSWDVIVKDVIDPQGWMHQKDRELLNRLRTIHFREESSTQRHDYVTIQCTTNCEEQKEGNNLEKASSVLSSNEFEQLIDRLLLFMTADSGSIESEGLNLQKGIAQMTTQDVHNFICSREKQLTAAGMKDLKEVSQQIYNWPINGQKLVTLGSNTVTTGIKWSLSSDSMEDQALKQEITKIIQFELLKEKIRNDSIPKFELAKSIGEKRLQYYTLGGREHLKQNRLIDFTESKQEFEQINLQWTEYLKEWQQKIAQYRKTYLYLAYFTVNDMRDLCSQIKKYQALAEKLKKQNLLGAIASKISFINADVITDVETEVTSSAVSSFYLFFLESIFTLILFALKRELNTHIRIYKKKKKKKRIGIGAPTTNWNDSVNYCKNYSEALV
ncbi:hypothetical protein RFI_09646 [Reticulomyxa filosa]|uniref:Uncharacterized protein n=1 Tax=Reticulomyxa filosa TaxID=46433 RepID=X6NQ50_RETFI|nr:hypothetical protein RFI_09646 [Reticulomyxa filosa]|eukprot:ETO27487.1 hypothetical protein RFI_09646 [Reticulomyxa filosa]